MQELPMDQGIICFVTRHRNKIMVKVLILSYVDFSKAFNKLPHNKLLYILIKYGMVGN